MKFRFVFVVMSFQFLSAQIDTTTVAVIGSRKISADDLLTSFEFGPAFVKRTQQPIREHLKYMIFECLMANEGERENLGSSEFISQRVQGLEEDNAVEQLYRQEILAQVKISEEQTNRDISSEKQKITFRWIFVPVKDSAQKIYDRITASDSFDSIFSLQIDSVITAGDRSSITTMLKLEQDNADLAAIISAMHPGQISKVIELKNGYYIIKYDSLWMSPITTQTEYSELKNQALEIRKKIDADKLADHYIKNLMDENYPVIKAEGLNILRAYFAEKGLSHDTKISWEIPSTFMTEAGPQPISRSGKFLQQPLVTFGKRILRVRDFVDWYEIRQFQLNTRSEKAFTSSIKKTVWKMVQDKLLSEKAYEKGLNRLPEVILETNKWKTKLLYLAERAEIVRGMNLSDTVLQSYYSKNKETYSSSSGTVKSFSEVKNDVKVDYFYSMEPVIILKSINEMKNKYPVTINEGLLSTLSTKVKRDSRSIDAILYKPGGTFPHVAFPTIDDAWSRIR